MRRALITLALSALGTAHAANVSVYTSLAAWQAAVSGPVQTQDFSGFADGASLDGVQVLPGVTLSSNAGAMQVFIGASQQRAVSFGTAAHGIQYYEGQYAQPYLAAALDIMGFESDPAHPFSTAIDEGLLTFLFGDGSSQSMSIAGNPTGAPIFIGVVSDTALVSFHWAEAHEGSGGNEETSLDNLRVAMAANQLPLPGTLPLALLALVAVPMARRRR